MEQIDALEQAYFRLRLREANADLCVDWAVERLRWDQEGDDLEIVLLASARGADEVLPLAEVIIDRYKGERRLDAQFLAGQYVVTLWDAYQADQIDIYSIDQKLTALYTELHHVDWLVMLSRNCEYASDMPDFVQPFEQEFRYIAQLWRNAASTAQFDSLYDRETSNRHDVVPEQISEQA